MVYKSSKQTAVKQHSAIKLGGKAANLGALLLGSRHCSLWARSGSKQGSARLNLALVVLELLVSKAFGDIEQEVVLVITDLSRSFGKTILQVRSLVVLIHQGQLRRGWRQWLCHRCNTPKLAYWYSEPILVYQSYLSPIVLGIFYSDHLYLT